MQKDNKILKIQLLSFQYINDILELYQQLLPEENIFLNENLLTVFKSIMNKKEYNIMYLFLLNKEIVISREKIIEEIWGYDFEGKDKIVDVYINLLRKKIENKNEKYIHTVRGFGYILKKIIKNEGESL